MIDNYNKCFQEEQKKEKDTLIENINKNNNDKLCKNKIYILQNIDINSQAPSQRLSEIIINSDNKLNDDKKLDFKEYANKDEEICFLNRKKARFLKKIVFKRKKLKNNSNQFFDIIFPKIEEVCTKNKLLINSTTNQNNQNVYCNICKQYKLTKEKIFIKISSLKDFQDLFNLIFNELEQNENKQNLIKNSPIKYSQIFEQKNQINQIKSNSNSEKETSSIEPNKIICIKCAINFLLKNNGISLLWEKIQKDDEKSNSNIIEDKTSNSNKNNINQNENKEESSKKKINNVFKDLTELTNFLKYKRGNIFDLILGSEDEENEMNDLEANSEGNKSSKNKNKTENKKISFINEIKNDKKIKKGKFKDKTIKFKKTIENTNQINNNNTNNLNNTNKIIFEPNNKNLININNPNNINKFNEPNYLQKPNEQIQPLFYNNSFIPSQNNIFYNPNPNPNMINDNLPGYMTNNTNMNDESIYDRLNNQVLFLKNKLNLITNINNMRMNNPIINNEQQILLLNPNIRENLFFFKNSMLIILNYMDNISEMLDKYSCINENSLSLIDSMIKGNIDADSIIKLENHHNYFSQLLNYNYNIQKMNTELCDMINKHLDH